MEPHITEIDARQPNAACDRYFSKSIREYGFAACSGPSNPPVLQEAERQQAGHQGYSHPCHCASSKVQEQHRHQHQLCTQVYVANDRVVVPTAPTSTGGGRDTLITTTNVAPSIRAVLHPSIATEKREPDDRALGAKSQSGGKPCSSLPPHTLLPPHPHSLAAQAQPRQYLASARPRTAPTGSVCNGDRFPFIARLRGVSGCQQVGSGTGSSHSPKAPADSALMTMSSLANRSFGTSDLQLASGPVPGSSGGEASGGQGRVCVPTGLGPGEQTLGDLLSLDLQTSAHCTVLCDPTGPTDPTAQPVSSNLPRHATGAGVSSGSGGPALGRSTTTTTTGLMAAAAAAAAAERELGLIRVSSLKELSGQLEGLRWLASGSSGRVFTGLWKGSPVAVKVVLSDTPDQLLESCREALLSRVVSHPAICQVRRHNRQPQGLVPRTVVGCLNHLWKSLSTDIFQALSFVSHNHLPPPIPPKTLNPQ
ncbi:hypothetical protein Vafri_1215 [Volvox africanus]|nr:hypothetical protein Vafri_1215 [Volvox africanus]